MKNIKILTLCLVSVLLTSCYEDYVKDYDYSGVYIAYQYDLRSFVVGEGMNFEVGAVLGGVIENKKDRTVFVDFDDELVDGNLSRFWPEAPRFTAIDAMKGTVSYGSVSQAYVSNAVKAAGITSLTPFPRNCYSLSSESRIQIAKGRHTGTIRVAADSLATVSLPNMSNSPFYALAFKITSAEADTVLVRKSYQVVALRLENMLFGNWYRGGESITRASDGSESRESYPTQIPCDENSAHLYKLTTADAGSVCTNYLGSEAGSIRISCTGDALSVSGTGSDVITDLGSSFNKARLLQNRKLFLNYRVDRSDGSSTTFKDTLSFRNRIRDSVNEWQDENPGNYSE